MQNTPGLFGFSRRATISATFALAGAALAGFVTVSVGAEPGLGRANLADRTLRSERGDLAPKRRQTSKQYRLLRFTGAPMKWGTGRLGAHAEVTWRLADAPRSFRGARNCGSITPIETALAPSDLQRADFLRELRAAMSMWEEVAGLTFRHARPGERADLVLGSQARPRGRAYTNVAAGRMVAVPGAKRVDRLEQAVICLNPKRPWKVGFDGNLKVYDLRHTLAHELGHVIGLDHSGTAGAVMAFRYDEKHPRLAPGDVVGAQRLYGPSLAVRAKARVALASSR